MLYVIEFWATWCGPCRESIPHLTAVQNAHKDRITVIGVSVAEEDQAKVEPFVRKMGERMGYAVAIDDVPAGDTRSQNGQMMKLWTTAAGQRGIPSAFIIDQGRVAWIGHPNELDRPLEDVLAGGWDFESAARAPPAKRGKPQVQRAGLAQDPANPARRLAHGSNRGRDRKSGRRRCFTRNWRGGVAQVSVHARSGPGRQGHDLRFSSRRFGFQGPALRIEGDRLLDRRLRAKKDGAKPDLHLALKAARRACEITHNAEIQPLEVLARVYFALDDAAQALYTQQLAIALAGDDASDEMKKALEEYRKAPPRKPRRSGFSLTGSCQRQDPFFSSETNDFRTSRRAPRGLVATEFPVSRPPAARRAARAVNRLRTFSPGKNDAHPISMTRPNVHIPRHAPMPMCNTTAPDQHERPPARLPDQDAEGDLPQNRHVRHQVDQPRMPRQPGHVERLVLEVGECPPHRLAGPPGRPLQLRDAGEEIDHAHVHLDQAQSQVGAGAGAGGGRLGPASAWPASDRVTVRARSVRSPGTR